MTITIILADDHAIVRHGLRTLLEAQPDFKIVGEAVDGRQAVQQATQQQPEVIILDIAMPILNGIDALQQIHDLCPGTQAIILSIYATTEHIFHALKAGARGYLLKESAVDEVVKAVHAVYAGRLYLSQEISDKVISDYIVQREIAQADSPLNRLTSREREIIQLVAEGKSSNDVAQILTISPRTVETYRSRLMRKLDLNDIPSLVKFAIQHGLTSLE